MRRNSTVALVALLGIGVAACDTPVDPGNQDLEDAISASIVGGASSWSEITDPQSVQVASGGGTASVQLVEGDGVSVQLGGPVNVNATRYEDFEGSNSGFIDACDGPFNHSTNDACYSAEEIVEGVTVDNLDPANDPGGMVVIVGGIFTPTTVVGPNLFVDDTELSIGYGGATSVGFEVWTPFGACLVRLSVYTSSGLLAAFDVQTIGGGGLGLTVTSAGPLMTRFVIEDLDPDICGELIDNVTGSR